MTQAPAWFFARGVSIISVYAFSVEDWRRSADQLNNVMKLLKHTLEEELSAVEQKGYRILISGRLSELPGDLPEACWELMTKSKGNSAGILNICLNYGGRAEIVDAVRRIVRNKVDIAQVHEGLIKKYLYHSELAEPDLIVGTAGEQRLNDFLLWQSAHSQLYFLKKYWPDFEESDVDLILAEYARRKAEQPDQEN
jgi:undecaprenyl diphosphate synthase